ncbi:MAG: hypothetical protein OIF38_17635 [Cellvibrionaceae bacterium]|nr:hypothetical protein [Cellvibrionaceae bacterium]
MINEYLFWIIGFITYLPIHLGLPLLAALIRDGQLPRGTRPWLIRNIAITALVFVAAYFLASIELWWGLLLVLLLMPIPWFGLRKA